MKMNRPRDEIGISKSIAMKKTYHKARNFKPNTANHYNPAQIKKQKEFYKNAKYVSKFKKSLKGDGEASDLSAVGIPNEDESKSETGEMNKGNKNNKYKAKFSLGEIYKEGEKARIEREAVIQAKNEEREKVQAQRKATKQVLFKKTRSGQPVMKYRIMRLLETIQGSQSNN